MHIIAFYVPIDQAEVVKEAMFEAGGGQIGHYNCCSFETEGTGQFCPNPGAKPVYGEIGKIERIRELKVEMVCQPHLTQTVIQSMKEAHPYEEVAFHVLEMVDF